MSIVKIKDGGLVSFPVEDYQRIPVKYTDDNGNEYIRYKKLNVDTGEIE